EGLVFDANTIRLVIGLIAMLFPLVVGLRAMQITDSISWSYHTKAHDLFVGFLFVLGGYLISYKGHQNKPVFSDEFKFRANRLVKTAVGVINWESIHEEDLVGWVGGIAACVTALCPTSKCIGYDCPKDPISNIHHIGAIILFSTTVYFCLFAFQKQVNAKIKMDEQLGQSGITPRKLRKATYLICGFGIVVTMLCLGVMTWTKFDAIPNITFWAETVALEMFGFAWLVSSQILPIFSDEVERQARRSASKIGKLRTELTE
ncbi:MAG TPA: hypothetical protein VK141_06805, partial [Nitrosomonas sp.]|nr:hypothetical protein [Nitrosomonas sp.]